MNEFLEFATTSIIIQKAKDITDFYNNLPKELSDEQKVNLITLEFYNEELKNITGGDFYDEY